MSSMYKFLYCSDVINFNSIDGWDPYQNKCEINDEAFVLYKTKLTRNTLKYVYKNLGVCLKCLIFAFFKGIEQD